MGKHNQKQKAKTSNASLGKALSNNLNKKSTKKNYVSELHRADDRKVVRTDLTSILEQDSLNEFSDLVALSQKKLEVQRHANIVDPTEVSKNPNLAIYKSLVDEGIKKPKYAPLKLPRKPEWNKKMSKEQLVSNENQAFLEWRRDVAMMEEGNVSLAITPFEKNLSVWKQLWSVIERCQLLIQIVDCRNPNFFYSADLERYISEVGGNKHYLLLLNKADFLDEAQIQHWNEYFNEKGVEHIFFSALKERTKMETEELETRQLTTVKETPSTGIKNEMLDDIKEAIVEDDQEKKEQELIQKMTDEQKISLLDSCKIHSREELLRLVRVYIRQRCTDPEGKDGRYMVGMIGYPNVGKSSVINVLCGAKKVGVASRPGKTKHFQTIYLGNDICLCDCPGLVFPSFASSKSEMVCCGVIPIDNLRDIKSPMELVVRRIPKEMFETVYKIKLPVEYTASELLQIYSAYKGYVTGNGLPDENKAARTMLKDFNSGKILFVHLRPDYSEEKHGLVTQTNVEYVLDEAHAPLEESKNEITVEEDKLEGEVDTTFSTKTDASVNVPHRTYKELQEDQFDQVFFDDKKQNKKLNKDQKRALKFAAKRGEDPDTVDLDNPLFVKNKGKRGIGGYGEAKQKVGNTSNKVTHFSKVELS
jgi:large subunit GTPase 1